MVIGRLFMEDEKMSYTWESQIETLMVNVSVPPVANLPNHSEEQKFKKQSSESSDCSVPCFRRVFFTRHLFPVGEEH